MAAAAIAALLPARLRSHNGGGGWSRINDDKHEFGGIGVTGAGQNIAGCLYVSGGGGGILLNK